MFNEWGEPVGFLEPVKRTSLGVSDDPRIEFDPEAWAPVGSAAQRPPAKPRRPQGAAPGITDIQNSHPSEWVSSGGVDGLEATITGSFSAEYTAREAELEKCREAAALGIGERFIQIQGATLFVQPRGHRWGSGFMSWVVESDGIRISLAKSSQSPKLPVAKVQISSLKLTLCGAEAAWAQALRMLKALGIVVYSNTLYRIDACLDLVGVDVGVFCQAISNGEVISRVKSAASFNKSAKGDWQGCAIGSRKGVRIVFYDKVQELDDNAGIESEAKREALVQLRWGSLPDAVSRVEFQIRGDWLRQRYDGLRSVEDVLSRLADVVCHLATGFFRIVDGTVDRLNNNQSRAEVAPMWQRVTEGFSDWAAGDASAMVKVEKRPADRERTVRRLVGSAVSVAALSPGFVCSRETFLQRVIDELVAAMPDEDELFKRIWARQDVYEAKGITGVLTFDETRPSRWTETSFGGWDHDAKRWSESAMVRSEIGFDLEVA